MTYTVWVWTSAITGNETTNGLRWVKRHPELTEEWEAYWQASRESDNYGYATLRDHTGKLIYAVFAHGNRIWHTLEAHHG